MRTVGRPVNNGSKESGTTLRLCRLAYDSLNTGATAVSKQYSLKGLVRWVL